MQIKLNFSPKERESLRERKQKSATIPIPPMDKVENTRQRKSLPVPETARRQSSLPNISSWNRIEQLLEGFEQLVGLSSIKELLKEIAAFVEIQKYRAQEGLATEPLTLHMLFKGAPGTGKTTVARLVGKLFKELGVLSKGHLVEVDRADLVGEYIGHTAQKTREQLKKAAGGILFIDEAYSLARGGEKDFGKEATDVLVKVMEDQRDDLIVILAGYTHEMEVFVNSNPGLKSRFPIQLDFPNYTVLELVAIAKLMLKNRQYQLDEEAMGELEKILRRAMLQGHVATGNARFVRNLMEKAIRRQAVRLVRKSLVSREDLMIINRNDLLGENGLAFEESETERVSYQA